MKLIGAVLPLANHVRATWVTHPHGPSAALPISARQEDASLVGPDVDTVIIAFAGRAQFFFLGLISRAWRRRFQGEENTVDSEVVTSAARRQQWNVGGLRATEHGNVPPLWGPWMYWR